MKIISTFIFAIVFAVQCLAATFTVTIDDADALDAMNAEIARIEAAGTKFKPEEYLSDFVTTQHRVMREPQLLKAAQDKVALDPDLMSYRAKKEEAAVAAAKAASEVK